MKKCLTLTFLFSIGLLSNASAATINFAITNAKGVPQAQVSVEAPNRKLQSNAAGEINVSNLQPGEVVYFSRQLQASSDPCFTAPEGMPGIAYTVPNPAPASASIALPALSFQPYEPGLSPRERGLIGLINNERKAHDLAPVVVSSILEEATDGYLAYAPSAPGASNSAMHCSLYGVRTRVLDAGYPLGSSAGETIVWASSATQAFEWWIQSTPHREIILDPNVNAIGLSSKGSTFLADFATTDPGFVNRAGWTGDYGDASLADKTAPVSGSQERSQRDPRLTFKTLRVRGHRLQLSVSAAPRAVAEGQVIVWLRKGHQKRSLRLSDLQTKSSVASGRWTVEARFQHGSKAEYLNTSITRRVQVSKPQKRTRHR
jgi:Cysteine-rich secretory protein family